MEKNQNLQTQLKEIGQDIPYDDVRPDEAELIFNPTKLRVLMEEGLYDVLREFIKLYIFKGNNSYEQADGTHVFHKHRVDLLQAFVDAGGFVNVPKNMKPIISHEALKLIFFLVQNTIEGDDICR